MADNTKKLPFVELTLLGAAPNYGFPSTANVRNSVAYGNTHTVGTAYVGALDLPAVADVKAGVQFDGATKTGTLVTGGGSGRTQIGGKGEVFNG